MSWSTSFREQIKATQQAPLFVFSCIANGTTSAEGVGEEFSAGSAEYDVPYTAWSSGVSRTVVGASIVAGSVRVTSQSVAAQSWSSTIGTFSLTLAGDLMSLFDAVPRGAVCRLLMGFPGWDLADYEPIALGVVRNLRGKPGFLTVECWDLLAALQSRITSTSTELALYHDVVVSTTTTATWTAGSSTTLDLTSATGFVRETGGTGAVKVTPASGDPFYLSYTGISTNQLTGVSTAGILNTTAVTCASGVTVENVAYLSGHPLQILEKTLASTGAGTNGSADVYPASWGYGISEEWIDTNSLDNWRSEVLQAASGSYTWDVIIEAPIDNGISYWVGKLASAGIWPVVRQGAFAARACQKINGSVAKVHSMEITDDHIVSLDAYEAYDSSFAHEAGKTVVIPADDANKSTRTTTNIATLPGVASIEHDLATVVFANQAAIATADSDRLRPWDQRIPEKLSLTLGGLSASQLVPGDVVEITSTRLQTRIASESGDGYLNARRAMVLQVAPNFMGATVSVVLSILPAEAEEPS